MRVRLAVAAGWAGVLVAGVAAASPGPEIDVSNLDTIALNHRAPLWWGQILMMVIEGSLFALLIASYFYIRVGFDVWPPPDIDPCIAALS